MSGDSAFENIPEGHLRVIRFDPSDNSYRILGDFSNPEEAYDLVDESKMWLKDANFPQNTAYNHKGERVSRPKK